MSVILRRALLQKSSSLNLQTPFLRSVSMLTGRLSGKVAIVTASTAGIGYAIAESLAQNGAKVIISSRKEQNVADTVDKLCSMNLDVSGMVCHVGKDEDRKKLIQKAIDDHGELDILVSNAGISPYFGPILDTTEVLWDKIFDLNLKSGFLLAKEAIPHLKATKGSMLFVSSITGFNPIPFIGAYSVSKTALIGLVKALASECAPDVRVNGIAPGIIDTDFSSAIVHNESSKDVLKITPLKRFGKARECAGAAVFLSSDDASYITGEMIVIAGGMQSRL